VLAKVAKTNPVIPDDDDDVDTEALWNNHLINGILAWMHEPGRIGVFVTMPPAEQKVAWQQIKNLEVPGLVDTLKKLFDDNKLPK